MKHVFTLNQPVYVAIVLVGIALLPSTASLSEEPPSRTNKPKLIHKFLGKTLNTGSHKANGLFSKRDNDTAYTGIMPRFLDPQVRESPVLTAKLFKIPLQSAELVATPVQPNQQ